MCVLCLLFLFSFCIVFLFSCVLFILCVCFWVVFKHVVGIELQREGVGGVHDAFKKERGRWCVVL